MNIFGKVAWASVKNFKVTLAILLSMLVFGAISYAELLPREGFPPVDVPISLGTGSYPSADIAVIQNEAVAPITDLIQTIDGVENFSSTAFAGGFSILVEFKEDISSVDGTKQITEVLDEAAPEGVSVDFSAIQAAKFLNEYDLVVSVNSNVAVAELEAKAGFVAAALADLDQVGLAEVKTQFGDFNGQSVQNVFSRYGKRSADSFQTVPSVNIGLTRSENADDLELFDAVEAALVGEVVQADLGNSQAVVSASFANDIRSQVDSLQGNLMSGIFAVLLVALLLISIRAAVVIALFIPIVLLLVFGALQLLGITINTISLFAIILTLGLFVDDATIIVEAIDATNRKSKKRDIKKIVTGSISRIGKASLAGTTTTVLVFAPLLAVTGILGKFIKIMPITVIVSLIVSYLVAVLIIPLLAVPLVLTKNKDWSTKSILGPLEDYLSSKISGAIARSKFYLWGAFGLSVVAVLASFGFAGQLRFTIFPSSDDSNALFVQQSFLPGNSIDQSSAISALAEQIVVDALGQDLVEVSYLAANARSATFQVVLVDFNERDTKALEYADLLVPKLEQLALADVQIVQADAGPPESSLPFQMRVVAEDLTVARKLAVDVEEFLLESPIYVSKAVGDVRINEVKLGREDVLSNSADGPFVSLDASFDADGSSDLVVAAEDAVKEEFDEERLASYGLDESAFNFDVSQESENAESFNGMVIGFFVALGLMFVVLVLLFKSLLQPLLIFMAIPFSFLGVFSGLYYTNNALSFFVMIGLTGLIGIVVNNSILLIDAANSHVLEGKTPRVSMSMAVKERFRPLVTTTLTTIVALLPLALNDPFWTPLAYTIVFGLASSTFFVIISFPSYYLGFEALRSGARKFSTHIIKLIKN